MTSNSEKLCWFALYCKSRHEHQVDTRLKRKGITTYVASYEARVQWGSRVRKVKKNLLPGYLLVRTGIDPELYLAILQTQGVVKFVGNPWPHLSAIPERQVESLQLLLGARTAFTEIPYWRSGDLVEVIGGPLRGLRGRVRNDSDKKSRVVVSLDLLRRSVAVEIDAFFLQRVALARHAQELL